MVQIWWGCPLLKRSVSVEGPVYGLQNWFPRLRAWRKQTDCCGCCVCVCTHCSSLLLLCSVSLTAEDRSTLKLGQGSNGVSFVKVPRKYAISALLSPLQFPALATLEILMWILHYVSAIKMKYFGKLHFVKNSEIWICFNLEWFHMLSSWNFL